MATLFFTFWASLLAALSTPDLVDTTKREVVVLDQSVQLYQVISGGECPKDVKKLQKKVFPATNPKDPWGTNYSLSCPSPGSALVRSAGPDRRFNTDDDIRSDTLE